MGEIRSLLKSMVGLPSMLAGWISAFGFNSCYNIFYDAFNLPIRPLNWKSWVRPVIDKQIAKSAWKSLNLKTDTRGRLQIDSAKKHVLGTGLVLFKQEDCNLHFFIINGVMFLLPPAVNSLALINVRVHVYISEEEKVWFLLLNLFLWSDFGRPPS